MPKLRHEPSNPFYALVYTLICCIEKRSSTSHTYAFLLNAIPLRPIIGGGMSVSHAAL